MVSWQVSALAVDSGGDDLVGVPVVGGRVRGDRLEPAGAAP
jgi:hypothetical protein